MNQYETERKLCTCYGLLAFCLTTSMICIAIPFAHWKSTLDVCPGNWLENTNCGCIFYGVSTHQYFNGGHNSYCLYAVIAPIPIIIYALLMAIFHMYRVCINNVGQYEDEKTTAMEEIEGESIVVSSRVQVNQGYDAVIYCWIPAAVFASVFAVYNLIHAALITDGYFKTCTQYRGYLVKRLQSTGDQTSAIHFRLSCQAIFDYMDYLEKDIANSRHGDYINTGASLTMALVFTWVSVFLWVAVVFYSSKRAYKDRDILGCCGQ